MTFMLVRRVTRLAICASIPKSTCFYSVGVSRSGNLKEAKKSTMRGIYCS
jgi:hypothetical protein